MEKSSSKTYMLKKESVVKETLVNGDKTTYINKKLTSKTKRALLIVSVISGLSLAASVACAVYTMVATSRTRPTTAVYTDNQLCVPCRMVGGRSGVVREMVGNEQICCFPNNKDDDTKIGVTQALEAIAVDYKRGTRDNSVHVYYSESSTKKRDLSVPKRPSPIKLRHWATSGNRIHVGHGIIINKQGLFTVSATGNYMIYSHMAFQPPPHALIQHQQRGHNLTFLFSHKVTVTGQTPTDDVIMEEGEEITCVLREQYGGQLYPCHVSSLISMMPLTKGDKLSVDVAPAQYLLGELKSSYFGLFLMG